jgi:hypothetical protein
LLLASRNPSGQRSLIAFAGMVELCTRRPNSPRKSTPSGFSFTKAKLLLAVVMDVILSIARWVFRRAQARYRDLLGHRNYYRLLRLRFDCCLPLESLLCPSAVDAVGMLALGQTFIRASIYAEPRSLPQLLPQCFRHLLYYQELMATRRTPYFVQNTNLGSRMVLLSQRERSLALCSTAH